MKQNSKKNKFKNKRTKKKLTKFTKNNKSFTFEN